MRALRALRARLTNTQPAGQYRILARVPGLPPRDITYFRGVPTKINDYSFTDPFDPEQASITLPKVTLFDRFGYGDLDWLVGDVGIDITWTGALPAGYPGGKWRWEGYAPSIDPSMSGTTLSAVGALHQFDNYLAKPEYPSRPIPYEWAIARQWEERPDLRLARLQVEWPAWWTRRYVPPAKTTPSYLIPTGVRAGEPWLGLVTRSTGKWEPVLSNYINTLLSNLYTERGRWTMELRPGRVPVLLHRDRLTEPDERTLVIDIGMPGVDASLSVDWTQSLGVVYGQGTSLSGVSYSGMEVSPDGLATSYRPLAALRQVHPISDKNGWLQKARMRREVMLEVQPGLDADQATEVGESHLEHYADPGVTGSITLKVDPTLGGVPLPRTLIKAGMSIQACGAFGRRDGVLLHISKVAVTPEDGVAELTVDSKYRDQLTVKEVQLRGRDSLAISRQLIAGQYAPPVPDQLLPWSYAEGSGYIPGGREFTSLRLFRGMPADTAFPWTSWTTTRPPKAASWRNCYIRVAPANPNASKNWSGVPDKSGALLGFPIKMAQAGQIRLVQIAAYDADGNVLKVPFHFSLYYSRGVNAASMPRIPAGVTVPSPYVAGQNYPFFLNAWEAYKADGTRVGTDLPNATESVGLIRAWGTDKVKAGYWPGSSSTEGDLPTGLLVDEETFDFDCTQFDSTFDPYSPTRNAANPLAGLVYAMIYCDAQDDQEVFFAGRMFRVEPGANV